MHNLPDLFGLISRHGLKDTPFYLYDLRFLEERALALRKALGGIIPALFDQVQSPSSHPDPSGRPWSWHGRSLAR